jgi:P pilus assembly chaperone PapD
VSPRRSALASLLLLLACLPAVTSAAMSLSRAVVVFMPGDSQRQDIVVRNPDSEPIYVKVEAAEIVNPGRPDQQRRVPRNPEDIDLLVTPNRLVVQPGQEKVVRLVSLKPAGDSERVYRVNLTPVVGKIESDSPMAIKVVVAYDTLVIVEPKKPRVQVLGRREGKRLMVTNNGNVYALLSNGRQCPVEGAAEDQCVELQGTRIYPGVEWSLDLPYDRPVEFDIESLQKHERRRFD